MSITEWLTCELYYRLACIRCVCSELIPHTLTQVFCSLLCVRIDFWCVVLIGWCIVCVKHRLKLQLLLTSQFHFYERSITFFSVHPGFSCSHSLCSPGCIITHTRNIICYTLLCIMCVCVWVFVCAQVFKWNCQFSIVHDKFKKKIVSLTWHFSRLCHPLSPFMHASESLFNRLIFSISM